jgi:hypothetical protein
MERIPQIEKPAVQGGQSEAAQQALFEQPPFSPVWPSPATLPARALDMLLTGERMTHPDFQAATRSWRLAASIDVLRKLGWPVLTFDENGLPVTGRRVAIAAYQMADYALQAVGARP